MLKDVFYISTKKLNFKKNNIEKTINSKFSHEKFIQVGNMFFSLNYYRICGTFLVRKADDKKVMALPQN